MIANPQPSIWIVGEGLAGTENQCIGVAEALQWPYEIRRFQLRGPWRWLSPWLGFERRFTFDPPFDPPWPDIVLASGRKSIAAARYIRKKNGGKTFTVFIQNPRISLKAFDLVGAPHHDALRGNHVVITDGSPNRITPQKLEDAKKQWPRFASLPGPRVAILVGGGSKAYAMTAQDIESLIEALNGLRAGLMITASRRTQEDHREKLNQNLAREGVFIWDGSGENPYFALLAWADFIVVTQDSVSMVSEAATTGKPVYYFPLSGGTRRFRRFYKHLESRGVIRRFNGHLEPWTYEPLQDAQKIAARIKKALEMREISYKSSDF